MNVESGWRAQSPVGYIFGYTCIVSSVFFSSLDNNQVPIGGLNIIGVTLGLYLNSILQPVNLKSKSETLNLGQIYVSTFVVIKFIQIVSKTYSKSPDMP